jgi:hypothetical protein
MYSFLLQFHRQKSIQAKTSRGNYYTIYPAVITGIVNWEWSILYLWRLMLLHDSHDNRRRVIIYHRHIKQIFDCLARSVTHIWLHAVWECYANMYVDTARRLRFLSLFFYVWDRVFCTFNWITILSYDIKFNTKNLLIFQHYKCEVWSSYGGESEEYYLLGYDTV